MSLRKIGRVSGDFVGDHPVFYVLLVRQSQMLLGRYVTEHGRAEPANNSGANTACNMVISWGNVRRQWSEGIERGFVTHAQLTLHVFLDQVTVYETGTFYIHLDVLLLDLVY